MMPVGDFALRAHSDGAVDQVRQLLWDGAHLDVITAHVLVEAEQIDLLLVRAAHGRALGLAHDGHHRHMVELGVVQAIEQVHRARAAGRDTNTHLAGELGEPDRFECGHLLMSGLDELWPVVGALPCGQKAVDPIAWIAEDLRYSPLAQSRQQNVANCVRHECSFDRIR